MSQTRSLLILLTTAALVIMLSSSSIAAYTTTSQPQTTLPIQTTTITTFTTTSATAPVIVPDHFDTMPWSKSIVEDAPLLYMPFWESQKEVMTEQLKNLKPCASVAPFTYKENTQKKARIYNECYTSDEYRKIRMTYYDAGENVQVFNSVWYPRYEYGDLPVLGIDILSFNRKKYLAIVDFQPIQENNAKEFTKMSVVGDFEAEILKPIKEKYEALNGKMSHKFYDETQFFSQQMLFARFEDENVIEEELFPAFIEYVNAHVKMVQGQMDKSVGGGVANYVKDRHAAYDTYSAVRDPATGLFAAMFGKQWADEFVHKFLFSECDIDEVEKQMAILAAQRKSGAPGGPPQQQEAQATSASKVLEKQDVPRKNSKLSQGGAASPAFVMAPRRD